MNSKRAKQLKRIAWNLEEQKLDKQLVSLGIMKDSDLEEHQRIILAKEFRENFHQTYKLLKRAYYAERRKGNTPLKKEAA